MLSCRLEAEDLLRQEGGLWPARPERRAAVEEWLTAARTLVQHQDRVEGILRSQRQRLVAEQRAAGLIAPERDKPHWGSARAAERWWRQEFDDLRRQLVALEGPLGNIERRYQQIDEVYQRSVVDAHEEWQECLTAIAASEVYDGLTLSPQVGLVPLGENPATRLWEFWMVETGTRPEATRPSLWKEEQERAGPRWAMTAETGLVLVLLPGGTFSMGSQAQSPGGENFDVDALAQEGPVHPVTLAPFFLASHELTHGQWQRLRALSGRFDEEAESAPLRHAVEQVSYEDCEEELHRVGLVLPTEAQWEYAARARSGAATWTRDQLHPFGLSGMTTGVAEWCRDWHTWLDAYQLKTRGPEGLRQVPEHARFERVVRGEAESDQPARIAARSGAPAERHRARLGVRPARRIDR